MARDLRVLSIAVLAGALVCSAAQAKAPPRPRPDLADVAKGEYDGDVISDSRGESRSDVHITVTKVGPNRVQVASSYPRLPTFTIRLTREMQTIQNAGGSPVFLLDLSRSPRSLDITDDEASWSGTAAH
jgi:hypothetical protein